MLELSELSSTFQAGEAETLVRAYDYGQAYFAWIPVIGSADRSFLARLTIMAGVARRRDRKGLHSIVDAHAVAAEVIGFYWCLREARLGVNHNQ